MPAKLVEVTRGNIVESVHFGSIAVVDSEGKLLYHVGDDKRTAFFRSSAKPLQCLAALEMGLAEKFGLDLKEIALISSSHSGEPSHIECLHSIMCKMGINEEALECGIHPPLDSDSAKELIRKGVEPSRLHCNCSGKHIGLIALAKLLGCGLKGYSAIGHPAQEYVERIICIFSGVSAGKIQKGIDGCGAVVYGIPLKNMALAYANICNMDFMTGKYKKSQNYLLSSMTMHPEMVAGKGRIDTEIMKRFGDRIITKIGAEGMYCAGVIGKGIGLALKIEDGNSRAAGPAVIEAFLQMGIINEKEAEEVKDFWKPAIKNHRGDVVGEVRPAKAFRGSFQRLGMCSR